MDSYAHIGLGGYDATTENKLSNKLHNTYDPNNPLLRRNINQIKIELLPTVEILTKTIFLSPIPTPNPADTGINGGKING